MVFIGSTRHMLNPYGPGMSDSELPRPEQYNHHVSLCKAMFSHLEHFAQAIQPAYCHREDQNTLLNLAHLTTELQTLNCSPQTLGKFKNTQAIDRHVLRVRACVSALIESKSKTLQNEQQLYAITRNAQAFIKTIDSNHALLKAIIEQLPYCPVRGEIVKPNTTVEPVTTIQPVKTIQPVTILEPDTM